MQNMQDELENHFEEMNASELQQEEAEVKLAEPNEVEHQDEIDYGGNNQAERHAAQKNLDAYNKRKEERQRKSINGELGKYLDRPQVSSLEEEILREQLNEGDNE